MFPPSASPPDTKGTWQPPTLPCRLQHSTLGRMGLNRRVRYGYGCFPHPHRHQILSLNLLSKIQQYTYPYFFFLRKEVIQPHLPIRLPCYDFTPVIRPAFGSSSLSVRSLTSGVTDPAAPSDTATLLRLHPSYPSRLRQLLPFG